MNKGVIEWQDHLMALLEERRKHVDTRLDHLRFEIDGLAKQTTDQLSERDKTNQRRDDHVAERLQQMYAFRDQITAERSTYITRDQLDNVRKYIEDQLDIVKRAITLSAGKDTGVSKVWTSISMAFAVLAAIGSIITAVTVFSRTMH